MAQHKKNVQPLFWLELSVHLIGWLKKAEHLPDIFLPFFESLGSSPYGDQIILQCIVQQNSQVVLQNIKEVTLLLIQYLS